MFMICSQWNGVHSIEYSQLCAPIYTNELQLIWNKCIVYSIFHLEISSPTTWRPMWTGHSSRWGAMGTRGWYMAQGQAILVQMKHGESEREGDIVYTCFGIANA